MPKRKANFTGPFIFFFFFFLLITICTKSEDSRGPEQRKRERVHSYHAKITSELQPKQLNPHCTSCHQIFIGLGVDAGQSCSHTPW